MTITNPKPGDCRLVAYDKAHERRLIWAIAHAINEASRVDDNGEGLVALRTAETITALLKVIDVVDGFIARAGSDGGSS